MVMTTLLMILMVVMIVGGIFLWNRSSIFKITGEEDKTKLCSEIDFVSGDFCKEVQSILNTNTGKMEDKTRISFHIKNNGNVPIQSFLILMVDNAGNSAPLSTLIGNELDLSGIRIVTSDFIFDGNNIDKLKLYPQMLLRGEVFPCYNKEKILFWNEIKLC